MRNKDLILENKKKSWRFLRNESKNKNKNNG